MDPAWICAWGDKELLSLRRTERDFLILQLELRLNFAAFEWRRCGSRTELSAVNRSYLLVCAPV